MNYFREKPLRAIYALLWIIFLVFFIYQLLITAMHAEIFAKVVHDPDHRMVKGDSHFSGLNSDNIRSPHEPSDIKDTDFNIIFLGDSYVYGFLMASELSPPAQLEKILRRQYGRNDINIINFGWVSSSPYLSFRLLKDIGARYKPNIVLMAVDMSDYRDEWFYKSVIEGQGFYRFVKKYPRTAFYLKRIMEALQPIIDFHTPIWGYPGDSGYFVARQPMEKSLTQFNNIYNTLVQMNSYTEHQWHIPFVTLLPPRHWQYTDKESPHTWEKGGFDTLGPYALENYRFFDSKRATTPFPMISFVEDFRNNPQHPLNFDNDSHWNKHGARFFAERVAIYLETSGLLKKLGEPVNPMPTETETTKAEPLKQAK